jgi:hypothetical protein
LALGKKIIIVKNATAYTWDWYCHLVVDRASLDTYGSIDGYFQVLMSIL